MTESVNQSLYQETLVAGGAEELTIQTVSFTRFRMMLLLLLIVEVTMAIGKTEKDDLEKQTPT